MPTNPPNIPSNALTHRFSVITSKKTPLKNLSKVLSTNFKNDELTKQSISTLKDDVQHVNDDIKNIKNVLKQT